MPNKTPNWGNVGITGNKNNNKKPTGSTGKPSNSNKNKTGSTGNTGTSSSNKLNIPSEANINIVKQYDKYRFWHQSYDPYVKGIPVAFFTTTTMNFSKENVNRSPYFAYMVNAYKSVYCSLSCMGSYGCNSSPFMKLYHNSFEGLTGKDLTMKTVEVGEGFYGYKQVLPGPMVDSLTGDTFTAKFRTEKNLAIIRATKLWMDYIENVSRGIFVPYSEVVEWGELDYVSSLYYFVLDFDLETILYYSRYTGVAPISNPYSMIVSDTTTDRDIPQVEIEFSYCAKQDLEPEILIDFNKISQNEYTKLRGDSNTSGSYEIPLYNKTGYNGTIDESIFKGNPCIARKTRTNSDPIGPDTVYKLVYR